MITHNTLNSYGFLGQKTLVVQQQDVPIYRRVLLPMQADLPMQAEYRALGFLSAATPRRGCDCCKNS